MMDIVFSIDNNYAMPCGVTITSVLENNRDIPVTFHIIGMGLSEEAKATFLQLPSAYKDVSVKFYEIKKEFLESYNLSLYGSTQWSLVIYSRLFLTEILPADVNKILYLDSDVIICDSLSELWNTNMDNYSIAGITDLNVSKDASLFSRRLGYDKKYKYINSGILLINIDYWRKHDMKAVFFDFLKEKYENIIYPDQDILNGTLYDTKLLLPLKYNLLECYYLKNTDLAQNKEEVYEAMTKPVIIHYTALDKPWIKTCLHPLKGEFLKYKSISLWKNVPLTWPKKSFSRIIRYYKRTLFYALKIRKTRYISIKKDTKTGTYKFKK